MAQLSSAIFRAEILQAMRGLGARASLKSASGTLNSAFQRLGLAPGDVRTARELYDLIYERIDDISQICGGNNPQNVEWANCGGLSDSRFGNARLRGKPYE